MRRKKLKSNQLYSTRIKLPWSLCLCWVIRVVGPILEIPFCAQPCSACPNSRKGNNSITLHQQHPVSINHQHLLSLQRYQTSTDTASVLTHIHANTSFLFMQCASFLQKRDNALDPAIQVLSYQLCAYPFSAGSILAWVLKFSSVQREDFPWLCDECCGPSLHSTPLPSLADLQGRLNYNSSSNSKDSLWPLTGPMQFLEHLWQKFE